MSAAAGRLAAAFRGPRAAARARPLPPDWLPGGRLARWMGGYWAAVGVLTVARDAYLGSNGKSGVTLEVGLARGGLTFVVWTLTSLAAYALTSRLRLTRAAHVALALGAALALTAANLALHAVLSCHPLPMASCPASTSAFSMAMVQYPTSLVVTLSLFAIAFAVRHARRHREREEHASRLEAELSRAQLAALEIQLRPHFLFNTLQSVATLMHRDVHAADDMLSSLKDLLRQSVSGGGGEQEVPLARELALLRLYTGIEAVRFGDRLRVIERVEAEAEEMLVPHLLLQPLVENAIRHAMKQRDDGRIEIRARVLKDEGRLELWVGDNGPGLPAGWRARPGGIGLENTRARLHALYGAAHRLELESRPGRGLTVHVSLPLRRADDSGHGEAAA